MARLARFVLAAALAGVTLAAAAQGSRVPAPKYTVDKSTTCVAPPDVMRRTHMKMLEHRRDRTVYQGVRGGDEALTRCIECHASKTTGAAIGAPDAFCDACHRYVGVRLDCFDCHQGKPGAAGRVAARSR